MTHLEEVWITSLTELLRTARSLNQRNPGYARSEYVNGQADLIARATGLVPAPGRAQDGSMYYDLIRAAITREDTVPNVVRAIRNKRSEADAVKPLRYRCDEHGVHDLADPCGLPHTITALGWMFDPAREVWRARTGPDTWTEVQGSLDDPPQFPPEGP